MSEFDAAAEPDELPPDLTAEEKLALVSGIALPLSRAVSSSVRVMGHEVTLIAIEPVLLDERLRPIGGLVHLIDDQGSGESGIEIYSFSSSGQPLLRSSF